MNLTEMRLLLRQSLRDEDPAGYRWTDAELDRHLLRAVREYAGYLPLAQTAELPTSAGSREVDIASLTDRVCTEAVEYPLGHFPASLPRFSVRGDILLLEEGDTPDGSLCRVYWGKMHTLDASGSTLPSRHTELVLAGAEGYAALAQGAGTLNRINTGGIQTPRDWAEWGNGRLSFFHRELRRLGGKNRVRVSRLYAPESPSADTD
jgi:hypothetical protein